MVKNHIRSKVPHTSFDPTVLRYFYTPPPNEAISRPFYDAVWEAIDSPYLDLLTIGTELGWGTLAGCHSDGVHIDACAPLIAAELLPFIVPEADAILLSLTALSTLLALRRRRK